MKFDNEYIYEKDYCIIRVTSETHGVFNVMIDLDDVDKCKEKQWSTIKCKREKNQKKCFYYAINSKIGLLHRYLMNAEKGYVIDHINGNTSDNRKINLQQCTIKENLRKQSKNMDNKSGHTGVIWYKYSNKWMAYIYVNNKRIHIGYYKEYDDAVRAREEAEDKYYGKFIPIDRVKVI